MEDWGVAKELADEGEGLKQEAEAHSTKGTMTLAIILLVSFAIYYFANWKALADVWPVR
jgi:hypothetical protein